MADLQGVLGYYQMTEMVNELGLAGYEEAVLSRNVPGRTVPGESTMWRVRKPRIAMNRVFVGPDSAAVPLDRGDVSTRGFTMPYRFGHKRFSSGELNALTALDSETVDNGASIVDVELKEMDLTLRQITNEWLVAQVLQGSFTINYGNSVSTVSETINFNIPASHIFTVDTLWTNTAADIKEHLRLARERIRKHGGNPTQMLMNSYTANLIGNNTTIQNYIKEYNAGARYVEVGGIPPLQGLRPTIVDTLYADTNQTDAFENYLIPNGKVLLIPDWPSAPGGWIEMQRGTFMVPDDSGQDLKSIDGVAVYSDVSKNPPGKVVFERVLEFPVLREPWQCGVLTVT